MSSTQLEQIKPAVDIQSSPDLRGVALQKVGIRDVSMPLLIVGAAGASQVVQGNATLTVGLPAEVKGTHMSRFVEILAGWQQRPLSGSSLEHLVREVAERLGATTAEVKLDFTYFISKPAPVSGQAAPTDVRCSFTGTLDSDGSFIHTLGLTVPMTTLCPCSKAISKYGAHNQRSLLTATVRYTGAGQSIEELAADLDAFGSCALYPLVKREDEKYITERAYENPKFVEDVVRDSVIYFRNLPGVSWFSVTCENLESIHNHSAWAEHAEYVGR